MVKRDSVSHKVSAELHPFYYSRPLAAYSLRLCDGIRGLVADPATEDTNRSSTWDYFPAASNDRRLHGASQPLKRLPNVGEYHPGLEWGSLAKSNLASWADSQPNFLNTPSVAGDQLQIINFFNCSSELDQQQKLPPAAAAASDVAGMTGVFNGNTPLQITVNPDKRFKSLPPAEILPRNTTLGGYIFVCNNDTMQEDLKRQLFGLPQRYRDSVRTIQPGLPLFLYNYTTHQLHGIYEAASFGGSNIDPTAWEDKKCRGESRFPAQMATKKQTDKSKMPVKRACMQVRIRVRKQCKPLEEDSFRPILHHYDGPKFRLQLSIPEAVELLDLFMENELP